MERGLSRGTNAGLSAPKTRRKRSSRGAILVESAIVIPLVVLVLFGMLEYGLLFNNGLNLASAIRAGSRTAGAMDNASNPTDYPVLQQIKSSSGADSSQILRIVVFKADGTDGAPPATCLGGIAVPGECNIYDGSDLDRTALGLALTGKSLFWAPPTRVAGSDYVGVWAQENHQWLTQILGKSRTITDASVVRVQPLPTIATAAQTYNGLVPVSTTVPTTLPPATTTTAKPATTTTTATTIKPTTTTTKPPTTTTTSTPANSSGGGGATTTTVKPTTTTTKAPTTTTTPKPTTTTIRVTTTTAAVPPPAF